MSLPSLTIGNLKASLPIIQGGMGIGISLSGLAAAVANAGGIGVIATAGIGCDEPDFGKNYVEANSRAFRKQINLTREKTDGIFGVNIMTALTNYAQMVAVAVEEGVDVIFSGAGLPLELPKFVGKGENTPLLAPIVSSVRAASIICKRWLSRHDRVPDAIVVEGPMAGGHLGYKPEELDTDTCSLERTVPAVVEAVRPFALSAGKDIPVIAAGGVYTGEDIHKYLNLGAAGVQMGTRFVATHECDAHPNFKQSYVNAKKDDLVIVQSPVGLPGRALRNQFLDEVSQGQKKPFGCPFHCLKGCDSKKAPYCITRALVNAKHGIMASALNFARSNAYRIERIVSVRELMDSLVEEYERCVESIKSKFSALTLTECV